MGRREILCDTYHFPARRGKVPILWPSNDLGRRAYCGVECFEAASGKRLPEPMRTAHITAENN